MAVPIGAGMSLQDVKTEIETNSNSTVDSLNSAFSASADDGFDTTYYDGTKDQLRDFQGYSHIQSVQITAEPASGTVYAQGTIDTSFDTVRQRGNGNDTRTDMNALAYNERIGDFTHPKYVIERAFAKFDLSSIPSGSSIKKVTLWIYLNNNHGGSIGITRASYGSDLSFGDYDETYYDMTRTSVSGSSEYFMYQTGSAGTGPNSTNYYFQETDSEPLSNLENYIGSTLQVCFHASNDLTGASPYSKQGYEFSSNLKPILVIEYL